MFTCPNCAAVVGQYPDAGVATAVCARCTYKYELSAGSCTSLASRRIEVRRAAGASPATIVRGYELTIATSPRETLCFTFETERDDDWIHIATGDRLDDRLLAEYDRTLQIVDIEYESSVAADALPTDGGAIMESRLAELRVVEELRAEVTRQLSANDEVEQLLRSHGG